MYNGYYKTILTPRLNIQWFILAVNFNFLELILDFLWNPLNNSC